MTTISNLTFEQVNAEAVADTNIGANIFSFSAGNITLDLGTLTGDTFTALTDEGILEVILKLYRLVYRAQETINATLTDTDVPLLSFNPTDTTLIPDSELVEISASFSVAVPLFYNSVVGVNS